jgi:thiamine pyrophosphate-dependent acetolactate synthase large subunit-like protein
VREGGRILVDQLVLNGVDTAFCVPGESFLPVLDALHDGPVRLVVCRQEGGAAHMAAAHGRLTGQPGVCLVTRGPGATNASVGVHNAAQDSAPMLLLVGQVPRGLRHREAFQELDLPAVFGPMAKWAAEVDDAARLPELVARAITVSASGRPGPVVLGLPEDVLADKVEADDARPATATQAHPPPPPSPSCASCWRRPAGRCCWRADRAGPPPPRRTCAPSPSPAACRWRSPSARRTCSTTAPPATRGRWATTPTRRCSRGSRRPTWCWPSARAWTS